MKKQNFVFEPKDVPECIQQDITPQRVRQLIPELGLEEGRHFKRFGRSVLLSLDGVNAIKSRNTKPGPKKAEAV